MLSIVFKLFYTDLSDLQRSDVLKGGKMPLVSGAGLSAILAGIGGYGARRIARSEARPYHPDREKKYQIRQMAREMERERNIREL